VAQEIPRELLARIEKVVAKRPRTVLDHILKHGFITTEELKEKYGYNHAPRAARDVREYGIALETYKVPNSGGRRIAAYRLDLKTVIVGGKAGRRAIPKEIRLTLLQRNGPHCSLCGGLFDPTFLQVDHKVPYEVAGESEADSIDAFMLVCGSCNRTKSWACEHCKNWTELHKVELCKACYWASPSDYKHIALVRARRADVVWQDKDALLFDRFREACRKAGQSIQDGIKKAVLRSLE
jgi:hypothetical protein